MSCRAMPVSIDEVICVRASRVNRWKWRVRPFCTQPFETATERYLSRAKRRLISTDMLV